MAVWCSVINADYHFIDVWCLDVFYPWSPKVEPWVNRWTFSSSPFPSPSLSSHHQICQRPLTKTWFQRPLTIVLCTVLYCTVLYCTVLYCTVLYCTVLYCIVLYCTVQYCTVKKKKKKKKNHPPPKKKNPK